MNRFWWVNHNATFKHEINGGYLWSPKREKQARSQFYDNMRIASPGELVLSYAHRQIAHIGIITDPAIDSNRPKEFGSTGEAWAMSGWLLPVRWTKLPTAVVPITFWDRLRPLLPQEKYSPLVLATGNGSQKAYLTEVSHAVFELVIAQAGIGADHIDTEIGEPAFPNVIDRLESGLEEDVLSDLALSETERKQLVAARKGQGLFRENVKRIEGECRLTGVAEAALLTASHIKPWRVCSNGAERLDGSNGLLLTPTADRLFDRGYITFSDDGMIVLSNQLAPHLQAALGLDAALRRAHRPFQPRQAAYLAYHRANIFLSR